MYNFNKEKSDDFFRDLVERVDRESEIKKRMFADTKYFEWIFNKVNTCDSICDYGIEYKCDKYSKEDFENIQKLSLFLM